MEKIKKKPVQLTLVCEGMISELSALGIPFAANLTAKRARVDSLMSCECFAFVEAFVAFLTCEPNFRLTFACDGLVLNMKKIL